MTELGDKLKTLREQSGMNKRQLADMLDVTPASVSHMEKGIRKPSFEILVKLCGIFNVPADELTRMATEPRIAEAVTIH